MGCAIDKIYTASFKSHKGEPEIDTDVHVSQDSAETVKHPDSPLL